MTHDLGQRSHGADLDTVAGFADAAQLLHLAQIDDDFGAFDAILQPIKAVQTTGQHPSVAAILPSKATASSADAG